MYIHHKCQQSFRRLLSAKRLRIIFLIINSFLTLCRARHVGNWNSQIPKNVQRTASIIIIGQCTQRTERTVKRNENQLTESNIPSSSEVPLRCCVCVTRQLNNNRKWNILFHFIPFGWPLLPLKPKYNNIQIHKFDVNEFIIHHFFSNTKQPLWSLVDGTANPSKI